MNSTNTIKTYICGCVRNCAEHLPAVFANIEKIAELFDDYHIVMAYDQSTDMSLRVLCDIKKRIPKLEILVNRKLLNDFRTENIANARNELLKYMRKQQENSINSDFNYFIMIDMDDVCAGTMNLDVLRKHIDIERNTNKSNKSNNTVQMWDALSFNRDIYYDAWALSIKPYAFSCWHFLNGGEIVRIIRKYIQTKLAEIAGSEEPNKLLECMSAFNGFAIYRMSKFENVQYEWSVEKNIEIISPELIENMAKVVEQPLSLHRPDDCEHRYFHIRATQLNGARICISPDYLFTDKAT